MSNVFGKKYVNSLDLGEERNSVITSEIKKFIMVVLSISLLFALYVGYVGQKINPVALLFIRILAIVIILQTIGSFLLYLTTGVNVEKNKMNKNNKMIRNVLGVETTYPEKILQEIIMIVHSVLIVIIALNGKKADKSVFHFFAVTSIISFVNSLYLLYLAK